VKYFNMFRKSFQSFYSIAVNNGRSNNDSGVLGADLHHLEDEENRIISLRKAIQKGIDSGIAEDFELSKFLEFLKPKKNK
jgi:antitoxin ParD1/3/4